MRNQPCIQKKNPNIYNMHPIKSLAPMSPWENDLYKMAVLSIDMTKDLLKLFRKK